MIRHDGKNSSGMAVVGWCVVGRVYFWARSGSFGLVWGRSLSSSRCANIIMIDLILPPVMSKLDWLSDLYIFL